MTNGWVYLWLFLLALAACLVLMSIEVDVPRWLRLTTAFCGGLIFPARYSRTD